MCDVGWFERLTTLRPIVAAAAVVPTQDSGPTAGSKDSDVWEIWRRLGEVHYSTSFMARQVGRLDWRITVEGTTLDDDAVVDALGIVTEPASVSEQVSNMALHMQVAGAYRYRHSADAGWEVASFARKRGLSRDGRDDFDVDVTTIRRDPDDPSKPDSPVLAARDVARELMLLGALSRAQARSRSSQRKIVLYPAEMKWKDGFDFGASLQQALTAPLTNEHSAAAVAPMQIPVPSDLTSAWTTLDLSSPFDDKLPERIEHTTRRLAMILDHPPEILLGTADVNHWSMWQIDESTYRAHVEPLARWPAATLRSVYAQLLDVDVADVDVEPDPTPLLARVPTVADTLQAYTLQLVSPEYARRVLGATDDDAPVGGTPAPVAPVDAGDPTVDDTRRAPTVGSIDVDTLGDTLAAIDVALFESGRVGVDTAIDRARSRVGAKVRTAVRSDATLTGLIDGVDNGDVVAKLGVPVAAIHVDVDAAVRGTVDDEVGGWWPGLLAYTARKIADVVEFDVELNVDDVDESTRLLVALVGDATLNGLGATTARRPAAPVAAVRRAVAIAGGGQDPDPQVAAMAEPSLADPGGLALSAPIMRRLRTDYGLSARQGRWVYGDVADREHPHPKHRQLNGKITDADGTLQSGGVRWYPRDHKGCMCTLAPAFRTMGVDDG